MPDSKFTLEEILQDKPQVITHDLQNQFIKKRRGGPNEANAIKRAELQAFELILKRLNEINEKISNLEGKI